MSVAYLYHPDCLLHEMGSEHPEKPDRLNVIEKQIKISQLKEKIHRYEAPLATKQQLAQVHDSQYIEKVLNFVDESGVGFSYLDPDTMLVINTPNAALRAAGAAVHATDLVLTNQHNIAFCSVRPPGHHALSDHAMGFCFFNNLAVGVAHAIKEYGLNRIAIVDFDVHHGNGTEAIFANESRVMLCSTFQHPFYPYSGTDSANELMISMPLSAGASGEHFRKAITEHCLPALHNFKPEMIFISAGFDAHQADNLSHLHFLEEDYAWVTKEILAVANQYAKGRIVSCLEGGYALDILGQCVVAHLEALMG
ncbi:MAG: histone deacetylase family protein [Thiomargarita sp.]|nr:histone deacetylase family protein [Thiomargarita sp.]